MKFNFTYPLCVCAPLYGNTLYGETRARKFHSNCAAPPPPQRKRHLSSRLRRDASFWGFSYTRENRNEEYRISDLIVREHFYRALLPLTGRRKPIIGHWPESPRVSLESRKSLLNSTGYWNSFRGSDFIVYLRVGLRVAKAKFAKDSKNFVARQCEDDVSYTDFDQCWKLPHRLRVILDFILGHY